MTADINISTSVITTSSPRRTQRTNAVANEARTSLFNKSHCICRQRDGKETTYLIDIVKHRGNWKEVLSITQEDWNTVSSSPAADLSFLRGQALARGPPLHSDLRYCMPACRDCDLVMAVCNSLSQESLTFPLVNANALTIGSPVL